MTFVIKGSLWLWVTFVIKGSDLELVQFGVVMSLGVRVSLQVGLYLELG